MFIDSHAHLTSPQVLPDLEGILSRAREQKIEKIVNICTDEETLKRGIELAEEHPWIFNTAATTPHDVEKEGEYFFPIVAKAVKEKKLIAIGETGLDYYYEHSNRAKQQEFLLRYFDLALECGLPLIFHCRDAFADLFSLADRHYPNAPAVLHCFTGNLEEARGVIARGWYLSLSGILTFKKSEVLKEVAKELPWDRILVETDTPYLAPQSRRGKQNEPAFLPETAQVIALAKGIEVEEVARASFENASRLFVG